MRRGRGTLVLAALLALLAPAGTAGAQEGVDASSCLQYGSSGTTSPGTFEARPDEVAELRSKVDGVAIQIGIVRPKAPKGYRAPVIGLASTYLPVDFAEEDLSECAPWFVENFVPHGYAVALISVRGTGNSGGCHNLLGDLEQADLSQAITYLGTRKWSNGRVGLYGASYDGGTQWSAAATGNRHLKTIVPASGVPDLYDLAYAGGTYDWRWWLFVPGYYHLYGFGESNPAAGREPDRWLQGATNCSDLDAAYQATVESFATGAPDSRGYWAERSHRRDVERKYRGSVLLIQGLQDWNVRPASNIPWGPRLARRGIEVKQLLGQWSHSVPDVENGHARWDFADVALNWFDRHLKGRDVDTGPPVEIEDASGRWRAESSWPPPNDTEWGIGGDAPSDPLLAPDTRSRYYFVSEAPGLETTTDWLPVPGPVDELCATCAAFSWDVGDGLRISGLPEVRVRATPTGRTGHVTAALYRRDASLGLKRIGWGMTDLRFPEGEGAYGDRPRPIEPGVPVDVTVRMEPMDAVVDPGEQVVLILGQGQSGGQTPGQPPAPVRVALGAGRATLRLALVDPPASSFFTPPPAPPRTVG